MFTQVVVIVRSQCLWGKGGGQGLESLHTKAKAAAKPKAAQAYRPARLQQSSISFRGPTSGSQAKTTPPKQVSKLCVVLALLNAKKLCFRPPGARAGGGLADLLRKATHVLCCNLLQSSANTDPKESVLICPFLVRVKDLGKATFSNALPPLRLRVLHRSWAPRRPAQPQLPQRHAEHSAQVTQDGLEIGRGGVGKTNYSVQRPSHPASVARFSLRVSRRWVLRRLHQSPCLLEPLRRTSKRHSALSNCKTLILRFPVNVVEWMPTTVIVRYHQPTFQVKSFADSWSQVDRVFPTLACARPAG